MPQVAASTIHLHSSFHRKISLDRVRGISAFGIPLAPRQIMNNSPYTSLGDLVFASQLSLGIFASFVFLANLQHFFPFQFRRGAIFSRKWSVCAVICAIPIFVLAVIFRGSKLQMLWIAATWLVFYWAFVLNLITVWNWAVVKNPRRGMGVNQASPCSSVVSDSAPYLAVGLPFVFEPPNGASPKPASVWMRRFIDLRPKALWKSLGESLRSQIFGSNFGCHNVNVCCVVTRSERRSNVAGAFSFCQI